MKPKEQLRQQRQAQALRENLLKRKAQQRARNQNNSDNQHPVPFENQKKGGGNVYSS